MFDQSALFLCFLILQWAMTFWTSWKENRGWRKNVGNVQIFSSACFNCLFRFKVQCFFTSTETTSTIRDGKCLPVLSVFLQKKYFFSFLLASKLCSPGHSRVCLLFSMKRRKKDGQWRISYFCQTYRLCLRRHWYRLLGTDGSTLTLSRYSNVYC